MFASAGRKLQQKGKIILKSFAMRLKEDMNIHTGTITGTAAELREGCQYRARQFGVSSEAKF